MNLPIWVHPQDGATPDLTSFLEVARCDNIVQASAALQDQHLAGVESLAATQTDELRAIQKDLAAKGVHFDVDRLIRPSLWDRIRDKWDDFLDRLRPEPDLNPTDLHFEIVLGMTHSTQSLSFEYSEIDLEVARLKTAIATQITDHRGVLPTSLNIDTSILDSLDDDLWNDAQMFRADVADYDMIWPPVEDRPGFALATRQDDGGLPIEIVLAAFDAATYTRIQGLS